MKFCKNCKVDTEHNASGGCRPCNIKRAAAWRDANPERKKTGNAAWQKANAGSVNARNAIWRKANPDKAKAAIAVWTKANPGNGKAAYAKYCAANPEKLRAFSAMYYAANTEKISEKCAAWRAANPEKARISRHNYRARKRANGGKLSAGLATKLFKLQRGLCVCCRQPLGDDYHLDHRMPIALGGANIDSNMQLLRAICNLQKHAKHPIDFMQSRGFLL